MKILHLSTSLSGGAGRSASRLAKFQASQGFEVDIISSDNITLSMMKLQRLGLDLMRKPLTLANRLITTRDHDPVSLFSFNSLSISEILTRKPDVVHLHNSYNLIKNGNFLKLGESVPIVTTLHDERFFTGACHITQGCPNFMENCDNCPQVRFAKPMVRQSLEFQRALINSYRGAFEIITPSHWLGKQVEKSSLSPEKYNLSVIHNLVSNPTRLSAQSRKGETFRVMIASASPSPNKGLSTAIGSMTGLAKSHPMRNFELLVVGKKLGSFLPETANLKVIYTGELTEDQLFSLMREVNLLLLASKSENSPNIVAEAQLNKLLILASNVGGIPELISDTQTGFLCEPNEASIRQSLSNILELSTGELNKIVENALEVAKKRHNPNKIHSAVLAVYKRAGLEI